MTATTRAAAYVRVSTTQQAKEGLSLEEQRRKVEAYIGSQDDWVLAAPTFVEAGVSGRRDDRPELAKVLELAASGQIDVLVIPKLDRLGRSTLHLLRVCADLKAAGVSLVSLGDSIDTSTAAGQMLLEILAAVAAFESARIGERVASVSAARCAQGKAHGRAPFGYRAGGKEGLVKVPAEAAVVQRIFRNTPSRGVRKGRSVAGSTRMGFKPSEGHGPRGASRRSCGARPTSAKSTSTARCSTATTIRLLTSSYGARRSSCESPASAPNGAAHPQPTIF